MRAFTPLTMLSKNVTLPRMSGRPKTGYLSLMSFSSSSLTTRPPSGSRTTIACFSGPRIKMPSMSACPPIVVRKVLHCLSAIKTPFFLVIE